MLVPMDALLQRAMRERFAVGSFDVPDLTTALGVLEAGEELRSPLIIAIPESFFPVLGLERLVQGVRALADPLDIPVAILLDHGKDLATAQRAIRAGMTSVMYDGSALPLEQNIANTRAVVEHAHALGVPVEGEIGVVGRGEAYQSSLELRERSYTDPDEALEFVRATGVDALAVAVGTVHGHYKAEPVIRYDLLDAIRERVQLPLVLHGGSSSGDERLRESIQHGVCKVNIYTDMSSRAKERVKDMLDQRWDKVRANDVILEIKLGFKEVARHYMELFGSAGRA